VDDGPIRGRRVGITGVYFLCETDLHMTLYWPTYDVSSHRTTHSKLYNVSHSLIC